MLPLYCGIMPTYGGKHICDIMVDAAPVTGRLCRLVWSNDLDRACVISRPSQILSLCDKTAIPWQSILPSLKLCGQAAVFGPAHTGAILYLGS